MNVHEWPLTLFTILAQMAVGAFLTLGVINTAGRRRYSTAVIERTSDAAVYALGPIMVAGLAASMFHLGTPLNAPNALRHIDSSWLSREIVFGILFAGAGFAFALAQWLRWFTSAVRQIIAIITAVIGVAFIWVMGSVYMLRTVPAWNHWTTLAQFYLSAILMGSLAIAVAFTSYPLIAQQWPAIDRFVTRCATPTTAAIREHTASLMHRVVKGIGIVVIVAMVAQLIVLTLSLMRGDTSPNPAEFAFPMGWFIARLALTLIGAAVMGFYVAGSGAHSLSIKRLWLLALTSYVLITASEIIGRFIFYGLNNRVGI